MRLFSCSATFVYRQGKRHEMPRLGKFGAYLLPGLQTKTCPLETCAGTASSSRRTSEALATFLQRLAQLDHGAHTSAMARTGGREAAMSLASGKTAWA